MSKKLFPLHGRDISELKKYMFPNEKNYVKEDGVFLGYPQTTPHPVAIETYKNFIAFNENQVGTFSNCKKNLNVTRDLERQLIEMLGDLYGDSTVDGYVTSGGTESNIMGIWIGRKYLGDDVCVLKTYLTHQSIDKACNLNCINNVIDIPYTNQYEMDMEMLEDTVHKLVRLNNKKIIIIATVGYTMTGTKDSISEIDRIAKKYTEEYGAKFYVHVDAAIGGLVYPLIGQTEIGFQFECVKSITVDPHKMGYIPFSAGVFMCRKGLQNNIAIPIKYAKTVMDKTLISSRNGASAVTCWVLFNYLGCKGLSDILIKLINVKDVLIQEISKKNLAEIVSDPGSNMICLYFKCFYDGQLPDELEHKYTLDGFKIRWKGKERICYKIYIMPHVTNEKIIMFVEDVEKAVDTL